MEFVYVVPRSELFDLPFPHGFVGGDPPEGHPPLRTYLERIAERGFFVERAWAENHSSVKQIIPYTLVIHGDRILMVTRLPKGGEARLHGKQSIGIGGHVNPEDDGEDRRGLVGSCARREISEELHLESPYRLLPVGIINDEATPVGSVHFGVVMVAHLEEPRVRVRETDALAGSLVPIRDAQGRLDDPEANIETWSALILEQMNRVLEAAPVE